MPILYCALLPKMIKVKFYIQFLALFSAPILYAQNNIHQINLGFGTSAGFGESVPFWLFSNQYSLLNKDPFNLYALAGYRKLFDDEKKFDISYGVNFVNRYSTKYDIYAEEAYGKLKFNFLQLQAGRIRESFGNHDSVLSSGGFLWSGNAKPVPAISATIPAYIPIPLSHEYLHFKGGIYHGWFENTPFNKNVLLHHKYIYVKAGGDFPVNISIGMHHYAQWGGNLIYPEFGEQPKGLKAFRKVLFGSSGGSDSPWPDQGNAAGNHIGSYNIRGDIKFTPLDIGLYWQSVFEDNSGRKLQNVWDGLYGIVFVFNQSKLVQRALLEVLSSTHQSGSLQSQDPSDPRPGKGNDNYFNNWLYRMGWSYFGMSLGNPLITSPVLSKDQNEYEYFNNNRVQAIHTGVAGIIKFLEYSFFLTYSNNYGTYYFPFEHVRHQTSLLLNVIFRDLLLKTDLTLSLGIDRGQMYGNNTGISVNLIKKIFI